jgi:hypothetical protein
MKAVEVAREEGGTWLPFEIERRAWDGGPYNSGCGGTVHAIKFDNGMVWDVVNGFRGIKHPMRVVIRVPMGRKKLRKRRLSNGEFRWGA